MLFDFKKVTAIVRRSDAPPDPRFSTRVNARSLLEYWRTS